ncbi:homoserine O-acetyltransferase [Arenimonas soli]|uniref:Homoserine O-acetyltransferase n=1 Tax=Arenimonas soli TaxID=2269504 RepID=A0ABQ1HR86_9GAMM|nr:homoserine O-succinyltransferase [Arenimonas soli]GGA85831.1 homoserine O-acetyltransferase [Arenimonas soli]
MSLSSPQVHVEAAPLAAAFSLSPPSARRFLLELDLPMRHAGLRRVRVRGEWRGPADAPWVVVAGGISAGCKLASDERGEGWWPAQVGPGRAVDTARRRVLAIDWIGADGCLDQPIDPADQADALAVVLDRLEAGRVAAFVGASYGAMVGLQFAARHGDRLDRLVAISGAHRPHPYASAWRALQRQVVALGREEGQVSRALSLARQWAMLSYRTPEEFAARFDSPAVLDGQRARVAAEDYLTHCGQRYAARWCSTAFLRLSESIDLQQLDPGAITVPTTVVAVAEDRLVPLSDLQALVEALGGPARLRVLRSPFGHDAFLKEGPAITRILRDSLEVPA